MPTKTVRPKPGLFPPGTAVQAFDARTTAIERREGRIPVPAPADSAVVAADGTVDITAAAGSYVLFEVIDEVQSLKVDATGGKYKLEFGGKTTADIAYNATAAKVRESLEALGSVGAGNVEVTGGPGDNGGTKPYAVKFIEALAGQNVAALKVVAGSEALSGGGAAATVSTTTAGSQGPSGAPRSVAFTIDAE